MVTNQVPRGGNVHSKKAIFAWLRSLGPDWDGMGADAIEPWTIDRAEKLVVRPNGKPSRIAPTPAGTIVIEWQRDGYYLEAEVGSSGPIEWLEKRRGKRIRHWVSY